MPRYMLDTNICIAVIKHRPVELLTRFNALADQLAISSITEAELLFGVERSARKDENARAVAHFTARLDVLDFNRLAARHYGLIKADLMGRGTPIGPNDTLIAAHARSQGMVLVTNNRREFDRVPGLAVEDWL